MSVSRQSLASLAGVLGTLPQDSEALLLYKHLGVQRDDLPAGTMGCVAALEGSDPDAVWDLLEDVVGTKAALRADVTPKYTFDDRWRELIRCLSDDGWIVESDELVAVAPAAEEATGVRDALISELAADDLDHDAGIRTALANSSAAFVHEPPDFNASVTNARIALETIARRAAADRAAHGGPPFPQDTWGAALLYLRNAGVLTLADEEMLARVYTFGSPGAHIPAGITQEEWARLARTFLVGGGFFLLRSHNGAP